MQKLFFLLFNFVAVAAFSQSNNQPFIHLQEPVKELSNVSSSRHFVIGSTCKTCTLTIDSVPIKVYPTGGFAYELDLVPGDTTFTLQATANGTQIEKKFSYFYSLPKPADTVKTLGFASIETFPAGNLSLQTGDKIQFKVKALPGCTVKAGDALLYEMPTSQTNGMPGIYQGEYIIKESDDFMPKQFPITIADKNKKSITKNTSDSFSVFSPTTTSNIAITKGRLAYLEFGLGDDRLGGAKIGYLDSNIILNITGNFGGHYRVKLSKTRTAYIPDEQVEFLPKGTFAPSSLTTNWKVYGDDKFDYVEVGLFEKLPYQSFLFSDPGKIVVDIFGARNNTNWIKQFESAKEIKNVSYEQLEDDIFRVTIDLQHLQPWGYMIYYKGNNLVIKIKRQPQTLSLKNLTIAIDAGHGGSNNGAVGPTGVYEKDLTLLIALKLQKTLEAQGATTIMTRTTERFFDNHERILFYRDSMPDLLVSVHLNSSEDPINTGGTSTYYRYPGFRSLSFDIYSRMQELGLKEYGNTGSFNFMLNSPTEYPNALVETLFLSNPAEEAKALDEKFQQQIADKITLGINDFLNGCKAK